jgi:hypothetical protein
MLGSDFKRGVAATLERVFNASNYTFAQLRILWCGKGASIQFAEWPDNQLSATFTFPNVDDNAVMPKSLLPKFIGMALHELGHAWFTDNTPWDLHRENATLCRLINGLEDPRIERKVIESGIAGNSFPLFENLINQMMGGTYVEPDDFGNLAFQLAVEGRRMNGYKITVAPVLSQSRYRVPMQWALDEAHKAQSTAQIVEIAVELLRRLNALKPVAPQPPGEQPPCEEGEKDGPPGGPNPGEGPGEGPGEDEVEDEGEGPGDGPADGPADGPDGPADGPGTNPTEGPTDSPTDGPAGEGPAGEGEPEDDKQGGNGKGDGGESGRPIEPDLAAELKEHECKADEYTPRPAIRPATFYNFNWS